MDARVGVGAARVAERRPRGARGRREVEVRHAERPGAAGDAVPEGRVEGEDLRPGRQRRLSLGVRPIPPGRHALPGRVEEPPVLEALLPSAKWIERDDSEIRLLYS